ncbi:MAG: ribonuclease III [Halanaerobiaceae bacterium]
MVKVIDKKSLLQLENKIGFEFSKKSLLQKALTHKSFANEKEDDFQDNERLEFLGDSVLDLAISSYLYQAHPCKPEGELAKMRSVLVSEPVLAQKSQAIDLGDFIFLGRGEEQTGGRTRKSILADTLEAVLGAYYLDKNYQQAENFILDFFKKEIKEVASGNYQKDYKTILQEVIQKDNTGYPEYRVVKTEGPDHNKMFVVKVYFADQCLGKGRASSKKSAQQKAARTALETLNQLEQK